MKFNKEKINKVEKKLEYYREKVGHKGNKLDIKNDAMEISNEKGDIILLKPCKDRVKVDITIMSTHANQDSKDKENVEKYAWCSTRSKISGHLQVLGCRDRFTSFEGPHRINLRVDFSKVNPIHKDALNHYKSQR